MNAFKRTAIGVAVAAALAASAAQAQVSDNVIKIGVLTDMSSLYTDLAGAGSVVAAQAWRSRTRASRSAATRSRVVSADHQNKPDVGCDDRAPVVRRRQGRRDRRRAELAASRSPSTRSPRTRARRSWRSGAASSDLTGKACSPNTVHWTYDTWMLANGTGSAIVKTGGDTWFFITADYAFGHALERDTEAVVTEERRQGAGQGARAAQHPGLQLVPAAGAGVEGEDHRPRQRRRRHDQLDQAGGRVRHRQGRAEPRRACSCS